MLKIYKRNRFTVYLTLFNSIGSGIVGTLYLNSDDTTASIIWFLLALGWGIYCIWSVKSPIFRITKDELVLSRKIIEPVRAIKLNDIIEVNQVSQKLLYLVIKNGSQIEVNPKWISFEQRQAFIDNIKDLIKATN
ncbi:MAG: hypothetical protein GY699_17980 [Desulfobacteraceae bacterium]|nr:hypothetical protein [Desulfobacteraceae bacterium]